LNKNSAKEDIMQLPPNHKLPKAGLVGYIFVATGPFKVTQGHWLW